MSEAAGADTTDQVAAEMENVTIEEVFTVVIACDNSGNSDFAFDWYIQHMHKPSHRLLVVHCIEPPAVPSRDSWAELSKREREKTKLIEDKYVQKMKDAGLRGKVISDFGRPGEMIVDIAYREKALFIVIGTRGMGQLRRTIMGSVSDYVVHHANCPVLVCRHK